MKIVLIGGHLAPALSVLEELPKDTKILFIGRKYGLEGDRALSLEHKTITELNIPFVALNTGRLQRKLTRHTLFSLLKLPFGVINSFAILMKFKPDVVVGFGGYVSVPVVASAFLLKIPVVIHEQTMDAGFSNRIAGRFATRICISWNSSRKYFPEDKIVFTGNPIRKFSISPPRWAGNSRLSIKKNELPIIYITGGSSGSHFINSLVEGCIADLLKKYIVIHQTGDAQEFHDYDRLGELRKTLPSHLSARYVLKKFIDPSGIGDLLSSVSLVISRSGMNTVTELIYFKKPAILIPIPFSQNSEQLKNAKFFEKVGLGTVLQQEGLDCEKLLRAVDFMFGNLNSYKIDVDKLKDIPQGDPAKNIVVVINYVYKSKTTKVS